LIEETVLSNSLEVSRFPVNNLSDIMTARPNMLLTISPIQLPRAIDTVRAGRLRGFTPNVASGGRQE
jgi:hypothetical protein